MARRPAKVKKVTPEVESSGVAEIGNDINNKNYIDQVEEEQEISATVNKKRGKKIADTQEKSIKIVTEKKTNSKIVETSSVSDIGEPIDDIISNGNNKVAAKSKKRQAKNNTEVIPNGRNDKGDDLDINDKQKNISKKVETSSVLEIDEPIDDNISNGNTKIAAKSKKRQAKNNTDVKHDGNNDKGNKLDTNDKQKTLSNKVESSSVLEIGEPKEDNNSKENTKVASKSKKRQAKNNTEEVIPDVSNGKGDEVDTNDKPKSKMRGRKAKATEDNLEIDEKLVATTSKTMKPNSKKVVEPEVIDKGENDGDQAKPQRGRKAALKKDTVNEEIEEPPSKKKPVKKTEKVEPKKASKSKAKKEQPKPESDEEEIPEEPVNKRKRKVADDKVEEKKGKPAAVLKNKSSTNYENIEFTNTAKNPDGKEWNLKISSWNVDGIRAWMTKGGLEFLDYEKPDILCLQEVKCSKEKLPEEVINIPGYHAYWLCSEKDGYAGVGIYTTKMAMNVQYGLQDEELDSEGRIITAEYEQFYLVSTYVPNAGRKLVTLPKRLQWNDAFRSHVNKLDKKKPVIICGDMNVAHDEIDLANPKTNKKNAGFTQEERSGMTDLLGDGFVDTYRHLYPDKTGAYTFWTYMMNSRAKNVGWRLDYFIVSKRLLPTVCDNVIRSEVYGSDHCPLTLFLHLTTANKPK